MFKEGYCTPAVDPCQQGYDRECQRSSDEMAASLSMKVKKAQSARRFPFVILADGEA